MKPYPKDRTADIRQAIEQKITDWLRPGAVLPSKELMSVVDRGLDYLKIAAKMDGEEGWGDDLSDLDRKNRRAGND